MTLKQLIKNEIINAIKDLQTENFFDENFDPETLVFNLSEAKVPEKMNLEQIIYDYATNIAFILKNYKKVAPLIIAEKLDEKLNASNLISRVDISNPGFINLVISNLAFNDVLETILKEQTKYGANFVTPEKINVEYISANPTGFLHVGHARGACYGDALVRILRHAGHEIESEYYVNDAGNQINVLANSAKVRYLELFGINEEMPEDCYRGQDIVWAAEQVKAKYQDYFLEFTDAKFAEFKNVVTEILLNKIKSDIARLNITIDTYSSEKKVKEDGLIEKAINDLKAYTYTSEGALFLNTTKFGDDKDRVLVKSDGSDTYLLPDIAYHQTKFAKADKLINIWGADHSGYVARMKIAMECLGHNPNNLEIYTIQLVRLIKDGQEFKMSKRAGTSVTLQDLLEYTSPDAIRFTMLTREINNKFDFDIDLVNSKDVSNPVFIVQYAHSRSLSLLERIASPKLNLEVNLTDKAKKLTLCLDEFPELIKTIVQTGKVNLMSQYLINLAKFFNSFYSETKLIGHEHEAHYAALVRSTQIVLALGLSLIGVSAPESM
ncbi:arginine--tRNA ligase [Mycoplasmopsis gallopavonis]|uniref:Arginine--tRNA ligase n=1 Tax=Mycoplasmopsis gallopavonis TaxID=76629 RepID=A0A449AZ61_9BACT|nr:arginine--tRNA ligase [Mycoplasmopsis gallopavonis]RIV16951.1 arginine--tRNA ligase [Mycoplasmopsis gallopavonis]VEU72800.1 Arginyl-tRNA synthetase [Mycoplasmopsis gallopavonis]